MDDIYPPELTPPYFRSGRVKRFSDVGADDASEDWVEAWVEDLTPLMVWSTLIFVLVCITLPLLFCAEHYCCNDYDKVSPEEDVVPAPSTIAEPDVEAPKVDDVIIQTEPVPKKCRKKCRKKTKSCATVQTSCRGYGLAGLSEGSIIRRPCKSDAQTDTTVGSRTSCRKKANHEMVSQTDLEPSGLRSVMKMKRDDEGQSSEWTDVEIVSITTQTERVRRRPCTCPCGGDETKAHLCTCNKIKVEGECQTVTSVNGVPTQTQGGRRIMRPCTCPCQGREDMAHLCTCNKVKMESECQTGSVPPGGCVCPCDGDEAKADLCTCGKCQGVGHSRSLGQGLGQGSLCSFRGQGQDQGQSQDEGRGRGIDLSKSSKGPLPLPDEDNKVNKYLEWDWDNPCACQEDFVGNRLKSLSWTQVIDYAQADGGSWTKSGNNVDKALSSQNQEEEDKEKREEEQSEQFSEPDTDVE